MKRTKRAAFAAHMKRCWPYYLFVLPAVLDCIIFRYVPMYGLQIAFKDYRVKLGIWGSPWAGMKYFQRFLSSPVFPQLMRNTLLMNAQKDENSEYWKYKYYHSFEEYEKEVSFPDAVR